MHRKYSVGGGVREGFAGKFCRTEKISSKEN